MSRGGREKLGRLGPKREEKYETGEDVGGVCEKKCRSGQEKRVLKANLQSWASLRKPNGKCVHVCVCVCRYAVKM